MRMCRPASRTTRRTTRRTARQTATCLAVAVLALAPVAAAQRLYDRLSPDTYEHSQRPLAADDGAGPDAGHAQGAHPFDTAFRSLVADTLAAWHVPGVSIAVVDGDNTWTEGFGLASVQPETPMTADTLFYTASTTKAFLAATLSLIIDSGNYSVSDGAQPLDWATPIADVLPDDFVLTDDAPWETAHITLEDALSHRTGLASHDLARSRRYGLDPESLGRNATVRDVTRSLRHLPAPLHTSPRTEWRYCNLMFLVLAHAVETLTGGRWLGDTFKQWIWAPLGMTSTFFSLDDARAAAADTLTPVSLAQGYYWDAEGGEDFVPVPHMPLEEVSGAGGIISTVNDYAKWLRCWVDGPLFSSAGASGNVCGGIPFSRPGLDAILTPKMFTSKTSASPKPFDAPMAYASAWTTSSYKGRRFYGHSGGSNAFGAQVYFFPEHRFGVVVFGNTAVTSNKVELILLWHLVDERFGIPQAQRYDWDKQFRQASAARRARVDTALERLYADRARPPLRPSLPLEAYTGTFHHPTYQNMTVKLAGNETSKDNENKGRDYEVTFTAERLLHTWPTLCEFVHVSGEHWFVYTDMVYEKSGNFRSYARAWFEVGADGRADRLMVEFWSADDDTIEGVIPFDRADE
ncbi:penicillin-binding protein [Ophiostoma piceae UAMH 11346]|uniref:Penicillin-binding protein n=1 Tax=Ophiostoma piceae (strain UAMH 11346) TaxID=1262450 RepID=S3BYB5_OPHP1|nr:penicillin-binding protein [Ophiostoma piceae UAMH 11346]